MNLFPPIAVSRDQKLVLILIFCSILSAIDGQSTSCQTPDNTSGKCVAATTCDSIKKRFQALGRAASEYVKKSYCGTFNNAFYVCCEDPPPPPVDVPEPPITRGVSSGRRSSLGYAALENQQCGRSGGQKVAFGEDADLLEFPWMALLKSYSDFVCGGSLISNRYILTAAHCFTSRFYVVNGVRLGEHDLNNETDCTGTGRSYKCSPPYEDYGIEKVILHQNYLPSSLQHDIALIRLNQTVTPKTHIKPICLPTKPEVANYPLNEVIVAGWGATEDRSSANVLQKATVPRQESSVCQKAFPNNVITTENIFCAGGKKRVDTCKGDSGGPLFFPAPARYVQFGISSGGNKVCGHESSLPSVYTNVASYISWITDNIEA